MKVLMLITLAALVAGAAWGQSIESPPNIGVNGAANTFTGVQTINSTSSFPLVVTGSGGNDLKLANNGNFPVMEWSRTDTGLPGNTIIGEWEANAENSASVLKNFAAIDAIELVNTSMSEQGEIDIDVASSGTLTHYVQISPQTLNLLNSTSVEFAGHVLFSAPAPTVHSMTFGTGASVVKNNGAAAFTVSVGTSNAGTGQVDMNNTAANGWSCFVNDLTTKNANQASTQVTATTTTSVTVQNYTDTMAAHAWTDNDVLQFQCVAY